MKALQDKIKTIKEELKNVKIPGLLVVDYSNPKSVNEAYDLIRMLKDLEETSFNYMGK